MKKTLLFSAAALCAAMSVNAEEIVYDFNTVAPQFVIDMYDPEGLGMSGEKDFIDKTGIPGALWLEGATSLQSQVDGVWTVDTSKAMDMETGELVDYATADLSHSLIVWGEKGVSRCHQFLIGTLEHEIGGDYQAATEEDWIATKNGLGFLRNANNGSRTDTYFQMPAVQGPFSMDLYLCNQGGKNGAALQAKIVPVVDGVAGEETLVGKGEGEFTAKRMYKFTYNYDKTDAPLIRVGCNGYELILMHAVIKTGEGAGVENVAVDAAAENAPIYNTLGVQVDENYKGLVIKGGKKYIQK